jgi:hypothetical protein
MNAPDAGTAAQTATISLDGFADQNSFNNNGNLAEGILNATQLPLLGFSLIHTGSGQSTVTLSNLNQFTDGTTM